MATIELGNGKGTVVVDDDDYEWLSQWNWCLFGRYAGVMVGGRKDRTLVLMHRLLMNFPEERIDHKNYNHKDNRRANLRIATRSQNAANKPKIRRSCHSKYKGVFKNATKSPKPWKSSIRHGGKTMHIGCFYDEIEAAKAYDTHALKFHGEYAYLNFPDDNLHT